MMRSSGSDLNGMPQLATPTTAMVLQATLQHVVLTYDPVNGRQIYVNGVNTNVTIRRRAAPSRIGTIPSRWCSAMKSRATVPGRDSSSSSPSMIAR
jgi:hypothetical protein